MKDKMKNRLKDRNPCGNSNEANGEANREICSTEILIELHDQVINSFLRFSLKLNWGKVGSLPRENRSELCELFFFVFLMLKTKKLSWSISCHFSFMHVFSKLQSFFQLTKLVVKQIEIMTKKLRISIKGMCKNAL